MKMQLLRLAVTISVGLIICLVSIVQAGGDKSAKTTVSIRRNFSPSISSFSLPIYLSLKTNQREKMIQDPNLTSNDELISKIYRLSH